MDLADERSRREERPESTDELLALLELEVLDRNLYRGRNPSHANRRGSLFGGQVAAQALRAATLTTPAGRLPHSMHGYFLRPGRTDMPTLLQVDRDRDGRTVSARRVTAIQDGDVIFTLSASFQAPEDGPDMQLALPTGVPLPEDLDAVAGQGRGQLDLFEIRNVWKGGALGLSGLSDVYWARTRSVLPDDPVLHACVLTYLSDLGSGLVELQVQHRAGGPSLDHAVWFHRHIRMDDWVLFAMRPISASHNRGLYWGTLHSKGGVLGATMIQESLFRPLPPDLTLPGTAETSLAAAPDAASEGFRGPGPARPRRRAAEPGA
ncbi:MAG TPA: acyl-CoA thioesterase domain-containing protein [Acidimicrobiales bacterium]|nr:acyl-CoA thioesterase domain-containing protein [Acidimicrobiales bacterium]